MEFLKCRRHLKNTLWTSSSQLVDIRARGGGGDQRMGEQGDHCNKFKRVKVNPIFYTIWSLSDYSASWGVGKQSASYIIAESSYLILGNKLRGRWQLFWSFISQLAELRYREGNWSIGPLSQMCMWREFLQGSSLCSSSPVLCQHHSQPLFRGHWQLPESGKLRHHWSNRTDLESVDLNLNSDSSSCWLCGLGQVSSSLCGLSLRLFEMRMTTVIAVVAVRIRSVWKHLIHHLA